MEQRIYSCKISVCVATYNGEKYIKEQIGSILSQLKFDDELIISDDHSTDNTLEVISQMRDPRIKVYLNHKEKGYTSNFEHALSKATGEVIFLADQDDVWKPNKVSESLKYLENYDFVVSDAEVVDRNLKVLSPSAFSLGRKYKSFWGNLFKFAYLGCCMCFKRNVLEKAMPFPEKHNLCTHDNWLFIVAAAFFKVKILPLQLISYRRHGNNTSFGAEKVIKRNSVAFMLKYRVYLLFHILKRKI
jgi:hypothetical protein